MLIKQSILIFLLLGLGSASAQAVLQPRESPAPKVTIGINHFQSTASIQFEENDVDEYVCKIYTSEDKLLMKFVKESMKTKYLIPLDHMRSGTYLLTVQTEVAAHNLSGEVEGFPGAAITINSDNLDIAEYNFTVAGDVVKVLGAMERLDVAIYPNPVSKELHLSFNDRELEKTRVSIHTLSGKEILRVENSEMKRELMMPISQLENGVFLLMINSGDRKTSHRFIKK